MRRYFFLSLITLGFVLSFSQAQQKKEGARLKNPASLSDSFWSKENSKRDSGGVLSQSFRHHLLRRTFETPQFSAIQLALWHGDFSFLPFWLLQKYRDQGLLQVLALSGQHVWALAFCFSFFGGTLWKCFPRPRGQWFFWLRRFKVPLAGGLLFTLAPNEPSMVRTNICIGLLFFLQEIPVMVNRNYWLVVGGLFFLSLFPHLIFEKGFQLSLLGIVGVWTGKNCFLAHQKIFASAWLVAWFAAVMALFFGKWVGDSLFIQLLMGYLWDQVFLPFLFLGGILVLVTPSFLYRWVAQAFEKTVNHWLYWEALRVKPAGVSVYRPSLAETALFLFWLIALAYWNLKRCQIVAKKNAYGATCIDLTRSARRQ